MTLEEEVLAFLDAIEWSGCESEPYDGCNAVCPACFQRPEETYTVPARRIDAYTRIEAHTETTGGHDECCALVKLRARCTR